MMKLKIQLEAVARAMPLLRERRGKISAGKSLMGGRSVLRICYRRYGKFLPRHRTPSEAISNVVKHDECILAIGFDLDGKARLVESADDSQKRGHQESTENEQRSSAPSIG